MSADSGPGNREVAYRLFAAEFEDATVSYSESDEERAPNYVITPTGGRVNRLFLVGVLTEVERVGGEQLRGRVVDPTGAFVAYAGQYQPDELAFLDRVESPAFLAITGKARTFSPEDSERVYTSVRPESISEVDAETRDRWVVRTAEQTLDRVATMASALRSDLRGEDLRERLVEEGVDPGLADGVRLAVEEYGTTSAYLQGLRETALDAVRVVAGERNEVDRFDLAPDEGGTEDAVLAGLASVDLGVTTPTPGVGTEEPAGDAGTEVDAEPASEPEQDPEPTAEPAETTTEPEPGAETPTTTASAEPGTETESNGTDAGSEPPGTDTGTAEPTATVPESEPSGTGSVDDPAAEPDDEFEDFEPGEFDLPEEEREEIEAEFGTEFETAGEVGPAGEADIGTPESEPEAESSPTAAEETAAPSTDAEPTPEPEPEPEPDPEPETVSEDADAAEDETDAGAEIDVDEATVEVIDELDDGEGAEREAVVETVAERHGVNPEAVADAIDDAMMSGRAYEPSDGRLKAI